MVEILAIHHVAGYKAGGHVIFYSFFLCIGTKDFRCNIRSKLQWMMTDHIQRAMKTAIKAWCDYTSFNLQLTIHVTTRVPFS